MDPVDAIYQLLDIIAKNTSRMIDIQQETIRLQQETMGLQQETVRLQHENLREQREANKILGEMLLHIADSLARTEQMTGRILTEIATNGQSQ